MLDKRSNFALRPWFLQAHYLAVVVLFVVMPFLVGAGKRPILGAFYASVALMMQFNSKKSILHRQAPSEFIFYTVWAVWAITTGFIVAQYPAVIWYCGKKLIRMVILLWASYAIFVRQCQHRYVYWTLIVLALMQIAATMLGFQLQGDEFIQDEVLSAGRKRVEGVTGNANTMGFVMLMAIWACMMLWKCEGRVMKVIRIVLFPGLMALFTCYMIQTGSRKSLLTLGILIAGWMVWMVPGRFSLKAVCIAGIMGILMLILSYFLMRYVMADTYMGHRFQQWFDAGGGSATEGFKENIRYVMYVDGFKYWMEHPIAGIGLSHFEILHFSQTYSQSDIIEPLACTGLIGFLLYQGFAFSISMRLVRLLRWPLSPETAYTVKGMILFMIAIYYIVGLGAPHWNRADRLLVVAFIGAYSWRVWSEVVKRRPLYAT